VEETGVMKKVHITLDTWSKQFTHSTLTKNSVIYHLSNGLEVTSNDITMPWDKTADVLNPDKSVFRVTVNFQDDKEATWFVLSYGGELR